MKRSARRSTVKVKESADQAVILRFSPLWDSNHRWIPSSIDLECVRFGECGRRRYGVWDARLAHEFDSDVEYLLQNGGVVQGRPHFERVVR